MDRKKKKKNKQKPEGDLTLTKKENITLQDIEQRKKRIEAELNQIQSKFRDGTTDNFRRSVISKIVPIDKIRQHPLAAVGLALAAGFLAGLPKKKSEEKEQKESHRANGQVRVKNLVFNELKRVLAKRTVHYFVDTVDSALSIRVNPPESPKTEDPVNL